MDEARTTCGSYRAQTRGTIDETALSDLDLGKNSVGEHVDVGDDSVGEHVISSTLTQRSKTSGSRRQRPVDPSIPRHPGGKRCNSRDRKGGERYGDDSFDRFVEEKWLEHLDSLPKDVAQRKARYSGYWRRWADDIDFVDGEVLMAVNEDDVENMGDEVPNLVEPERDWRDESPEGAFRTREGMLLCRHDDIDDPADTCESAVGSPPCTDEARRDQPELEDEHTQGGWSEAKLSSGDEKRIDEAVNEFAASTILRARESFAKFKGLGLEEISHEMVAESSAGVAGWAAADIKDLKDDATMKCWSFGKEETAVEKENEQVAKLIVALGSLKSGKKTILKAVAERLGITDDEEIQSMVEGKSETKLRVPRDLRSALVGVGLGPSLEPLNLFDVIEKDQILAADWSDLEFEVALDSGAVVHVCSLDDTPGYKIEESPGSRRKQ